jgi:hypothetical protein
MRGRAVRNAYGQQQHSSAPRQSAAFPLLLLLLLLLVRLVVVVVVGLLAAQLLAAAAGARTADTVRLLVPLMLPLPRMRRRLHAHPLRPTASTDRQPDSDQPLRKEGCSVGRWSNIIICR